MGVRMRRRCWVLLPAILGLLAGRETHAAWPVGPNLDQAYKPGIVDGDERQPVLCADGDRGWCLAWNQDFYTFAIRVQRLDRFGNLLWGANGHVVTSWTLGETSQALAAMRPFDDGQLLLATGSGASQQLGLYCVDPQGNSVWGSQPVPVSDSASSVVRIWPVSPSSGWLLWWINTPTGGFWRARLVNTGDP